MLVIALASVLCHAQTHTPATHLVAGTVHDPSDAAIVGAEVDLVLPDGRILSQVKTGSSGNFRLLEFDQEPTASQQEGVWLTIVNLKVGDRQQLTANIVLPIAVVQQEVYRREQRACTTREQAAYSGTPITITTRNDDNHDGISNDRPAGLSRNAQFEQN